MKAIFLVKKTNPEKAFELREIEKPKPIGTQVLIKVEAFGLNFADVMARQGLYEDAPPIPCVLGYDVVGTIEEIGEKVTNVKIGQRVLALTRFGGYAEFAVTDSIAVAPISFDMPIGEAVALATQYCTAYYCSEEMTTLNPGDHVLIHAAAGGVGTALVQMAKNKGCIIYGTASASKHQQLKEQGVDFPIDYQTKDFAVSIREIVKERGVDVIFDSIGGSSIRKGYKLLNYGGRIVCLGASELIAAKGNIFKLLKLVFGFGLFSPISMLKYSKSVISVNMLHIADHKPDLYQKLLKGVIELYDKKLIKPIVGGEFTTDQIAQAHELLEKRKSVGKIVVRWV